MCGLVDLLYCAHPYFEMMKELQHEIREMKRNVAKVGRSLGLRRDNSFLDEVMADEPSANFRPLTYEYDGTTILGNTCADLKIQYCYIDTLMG